MKAEITKKYLKKLIKEKGIPYLDIIAKKEHQTLLRFYDSLDNSATGNEQLFFYSATKPMTVTCALRLIEEGRLSLDDEVAKYIPAFEDTFLLGGGQTKGKMTVWHLFTMSGGLNYNFWTEPLNRLRRETDCKANTIDVVSQFVKTPLLFEPGQQFEYSLCHDVLAAVVEAASGKRFSEYMKEALFQPLGIKNTGFHTENEVDIAPIYAAKEDGTIVEIKRENELVFGENYDSGGAGAIGCVEDYSIFADAMACGGVGANGCRILQEKTVQAMRMEMPVSFSVNNTYTCVQGAEYGYGLGVRTRKIPTTWGLPVGEFGWDGAAGLYMMADPVKKISIVIGMHVKYWPYIFLGEHLRLVQCVYEDLQEEGLL